MTHSIYPTATPRQLCDRLEESLVVFIGHVRRHIKTGFTRQERPHIAAYCDVVQSSTEEATAIISQVIAPGEARERVMRDQIASLDRMANHLIEMASDLLEKQKASVMQSSHHESPEKPVDPVPTSPEVSVEIPPAVTQETVDHIAATVRRLLGHMIFELSQGLTDEQVPYLMRAFTTLGFPSSMVLELQQEGFDRAFAKLKAENAAKLAEAQTGVA